MAGRYQRTGAHGGMGPLALKKKKAVKRKRKDGPIDPKAFVAWLKKRGACPIGLAECKARLAMAQGYLRSHPGPGLTQQPVEFALAAMIGECSSHWPALGSYPESYRFGPSYLRWLGRITAGREFEHWRDLSAALTRQAIRKAMKRDGVEG